MKVTGTTVQECNKKMKALEIKLKTEKKEMWKQNPNNAALTLARSAKAWMGTCIYDVDIYPKW